MFFIFLTFKWGRDGLLAFPEYVTDACLHTGLSLNTDTYCGPLTITLQLRLFCSKLVSKFGGEIIVKIGQYFAKLRTIVVWHLFLRTRHRNVLFIY